MRVAVIGGTGHIGTYLVPRLVEAGHTVVCVSRRRRTPYQPHPAWAMVEFVEADRAALDETGEFGSLVAELAPDVAIDLICFTPESARGLVEALRGRVQQFLHCGTMSVHGHTVEPPTVEEQPRHPFGEYGCRKAAIEAWLLAEARRTGFPATVLHPGHIVGPGWAPANPAGHFDPRVFADLAEGREVVLPNMGLETLHHVHAADVAQAFVRAMNNWSAAVGESFHVLSPAALTLRGYAEAVAGWFGQPARLRYLPWEEWRQTVSPEDAEATWDHIAHSPNGSVAKARRLLGYEPRYRSLEAVRESVAWLIENGRLNIGGRASAI